MIDDVGEITEADMALVERFAADADERGYISTGDYPELSPQQFHRIIMILVAEAEIDDVQFSPLH